jgi:hypothetical protein
MKFKEYLKSLQDFADKNPNTLEMDVVYSKDDEGNGYHLVNEGEPSLGMFSENGDYYCEQDEEYLIEAGDIKEFIPNAILIN